jgi:hypothetical protein
MTDTIERAVETEPMSYRTMTTDDAIELRIERIRELERDHYRLALVAEENGGALTAAQDAQRVNIERRITHQVDIVWPGDSTPHTPAPDYPDGLDEADSGDPSGSDEPAPPGEVPARADADGWSAYGGIPRRGAPADPPTFDSLGELGPPLRDTEHVHHAAHGDGEPVEDAPELPDGAPLGDARDEDDEVHSWGGAPPFEPSPLQRTSHFPSERDRPRHAE